MLAILRSCFQLVNQYLKHYGLSIFHPKLEKITKKIHFSPEDIPISKEKYYLCTCLKISKYEYN